LSVAEPNPSNTNSAVHVVIQSLGRTEKDHVLIEILNSLVAEPFYAELRTKQQLGYVVSSGIRALEDTRTIAFVAQSSVVPVLKLTAEIIKFLESVEEKILEPLSKGDLAVYVKGAIDSKTEPDKQLAIEVTRNWSEIASGRLQFDRVQREAAALLDVTKEDLIQFWRTIYAGDGRRVLITQVIPRTGAASSPEPAASTGYTRDDLSSPDGIRLGIDDIEQFRRDRDDGELTV
jgi:secreted Zn-dependent insulinase-like peptidase